MDDPLASFKKPPVVETALSVQFKSLPGFANAHLGLFWSEVRNNYPQVRDAPLLEVQQEHFGSELSRRPRLPSLRISQVPPGARLQMTSLDGHTMIQIQNGRLAYNWMRGPGGVYPRWQQVLPGFQDALDKFQLFLQPHDLGGIEPDQWEVTYVNHLLRGREWNSPVDWTQVLPGLIGGSMGVTTGELESLKGNWQFVMPQEAGRVHVDVFHGFSGSKEDADELLVLQLTARGRIDSESGRTLQYGLTLGHDAIVRIFTEITGERAHLIWEREQ